MANGVRQTSNGVVTTTSDGAVRTTVAETIIDSFEDGGISEYGGGTSKFSVVDESNEPISAQDGSKMLFSSSADGSGTIRSTSGLDNYFGKGNVAHVYFQPRGTSDSAFVLFGLKDGNNKYRIFLNLNDQLKLQSEVDGSVSDLDTVFGFGWEADKWYRIEIVWDDGTLSDSRTSNDNDIEVEVFDTTDGTAVNDPVSANNSDHANQDGIGFSSSADEDVYFDYYHIP